jgi:hypothetical protein
VKLSRSMSRKINKRTRDLELLRRQPAGYG